MAASTPHTIRFYCTEDEYRALRDRMAHAGFSSLSAYIAYLIQQEHPERSNDHGPSASSPTANSPESRPDHP